MEGYDHHCMFFSKCIAGGNLIPFYASIGMLVVNFCLIGFSAAVYGNLNDNPLVTPKHKIAKAAVNLTMNVMNNLDLNQSDFS